MTVSTACRFLQFETFEAKAQFTDDAWFLWHQLPVIRRRCGNLFVSFNPIDDQFANLLAGAINHGRVLIHVVTTAAIDAVVVGRKPQLLLGANGLP